MNWKELDSIIDSYYEAIYRYCFKMVRNKEDAEDLVQEVFISINKLLNSRRNIELHNNYLYKIAYNLCVDKIRRDRIIRFISFEKSDMKNYEYEKDEYFQDELSEELNKIMSSLNADERSVLIFRALDDMEYEEISKIMGKTTVALRKQYERTRKKIMKKLEEEERSNDGQVSLIRRN